MGVASMENDFVCCYDAEYPDILRESSHVGCYLFGKFPSAKKPSNKTFPPTTPPTLLKLKILFSKNEIISKMMVIKIDKAKLSSLNSRYF